ncbi:TagK domain-containing protein [Achromobacter spanius]|uniref:TagK domain-containing protein n=1 Tax=Achromobacter spanius TaxID=217203 RepID=UPI0038292E01
MSQFTVDRRASTAWGIWMSAHAGRASDGMRIHAMHEHPVCLQAETGALVPHHAQDALGTEHSVFGVDDQQRAWIHNGCVTLSCRVNGAEMRPGERWPLADRDEVIVGLTRLSVLQSDSAQQWEAWGGEAPGGGIGDDVAALQALRALGDTDIDPGAFAPDARRHGRAGLEPDALPSKAQDPLQVLASEFDQAIQGTYQGIRATHAFAAAAPSSTLAPPPDPFDDPPPPSVTRMLLEDLLPEATDIDSILDEMNAFDESRIFDDEPNHDVLSLLAEQPGNGAPGRAIASLARREHHDLSIDSYFEQDISESTPLAVHHAEHRPPAN